MHNKPLIEQLSSRLSPVHQTGEVDPELVAANFGVSYQPNAPLPEADSTIGHAEDDDTDLILNTHAKRPDPKPSLVSIAIARLQSLKPLTPERQKEVTAMLRMILEQPLAVIDEFMAVLEQEHFEAIDDRWERTRVQGRELSDSMPMLEAELAQALNYSNQAEETRGQRKQDLGNAFEQRRRISAFATEREIQTADDRLQKARAAMEAANAKSLQRQQELAVAESKVASARENLRLFQQEMRRCEAELRGEPYFHPELGLSVDPKSYREGW
jgi:hypothetical protein